MKYHTQRLNMSTRELLSGEVDGVCYEIGLGDLEKNSLYSKKRCHPLRGGSG